MARIHEVQTIETGKTYEVRNRRFTKTTMGEIKPNQSIVFSYDDIEEISYTGNCTFYVIDDIAVNEASKRKNKNLIVRLTEFEPDSYGEDRVFHEKYADTEVFLMENI
ncbi:hypothetical protein PBI_CANTARE_97 [Brevibacterium phage Cantare]|uniref:Uncharacterized protein n=1 Tax=Brevibacterium phage Cantare TaxID=2338395 RepID=A0A3G3LZG7_9CAUD|nr:hypothetical protein PQD70_gp097 [Brevibacterium phage Cantare]AYQ99317.1 hypothetical protein PBI_CANTARE_97 [Brevibacterium phage Cantare]